MFLGALRHCVRRSLPSLAILIISTCLSPARTAASTPLGGTRVAVGPIGSTSPAVARHSARRLPPSPATPITWTYLSLGLTDAFTPLGGTQMAVGPTGLT